MTEPMDQVFDERQMTQTDLHYFTCRVKKAKDMDTRFSTTRVSEAFKAVEDFAASAKITQSDAELVLELRLADGTTEFKTSVYHALNQMLKTVGNGKLRWSLRVY